MLEFIERLTKEMDEYRIILSPKTFYVYVIEHGLVSLNNIQHVFEWTTELPTRSGMYKARHINGDLYWRDVVVNGAYVNFNDVQAGDLNQYTHWLGPLPEPEMLK